MKQNIKIKNIIKGTGLALVVWAALGELAQKAEYTYIAKARDSKLAAINYSAHRLLPHDANIFVKMDAKHYEELAKYYENRARIAGKIADYSPIVIARAN